MYRFKSTEIIGIDGATTDNTTAGAAKFYVIPVSRTLKSRVNQFIYKAALVEGTNLYFVQADPLHAAYAKDIVKSVPSGADNGRFHIKWMFRW